jgi:hypothetical protein
MTLRGKKSIRNSTLQSQFFDLQRWRSLAFVFAKEKNDSGQFNPTCRSVAIRSGHAPARPVDFVGYKRDFACQRGAVNHRIIRPDSPKGLTASLSAATSLSPAGSEKNASVSRSSGSSGSPTWRRHQTAAP